VWNIQLQHLLQKKRVTSTSKLRLARNPVTSMKTLHLAVTPAMLASAPLVKMRVKTETLNIAE